jgi:hypothetical protein
VVLSGTLASSTTKTGRLDILFSICIIHPCGSSKYKYKQAKYYIAESGVKHQKIMNQSINPFLAIVLSALLRFTESNHPFFL